MSPTKFFQKLSLATPPLTPSSSIATCPSIDSRDSSFATTAPDVVDPQATRFILVNDIPTHLHASEWKNIFSDALGLATDKGSESVVGICMLGPASTSIVVAVSDVRHACTLKSAIEAGEITLIRSGNQDQTCQFTTAQEIQHHLGSLPVIQATNAVTTLVVEHQKPDYDNEDSVTTWSTIDNVVSTNHKALKELLEGFGPIRDQKKIPVATSALASYPVHEKFQVEYMDARHGFQMREALHDSEQFGMRITVLVDAELELAESPTQIPSCGLNSVIRKPLTTIRSPMPTAASFFRGGDPFGQQSPAPIYSLAGDSAFSDSGSSCQSVASPRMPPLCVYIPESLPQSDESPTVYHTPSPPTFYPQFSYAPAYPAPPPAYPTYFDEHYYEVVQRTRVMFPGYYPPVVSSSPPLWLSSPSVPYRDVGQYSPPLSPQTKEAEAQAHVTHAETPTESIPVKINATIHKTPENNMLNIQNIREGIDTRTTVMIRDIPNKMSSNDFLAFIYEVCPRQIDFAYLRVDFSNGCNVGYAFVNFITVQALLAFAEAKLETKWNMFSSEKSVQMSYATYQGKEALIEKFRNSCIMDVQEAWRPRIFYSEHGERQGLPEPFPAPTHMRRKERSTHNSKSSLFTINDNTSASERGFGANSGSKHYSVAGNGPVTYNRRHSHKIKLVE